MVYYLWRVKVVDVFHFYERILSDFDYEREILMVNDDDDDDHLHFQHLLK
jgi:hypothetical protein